MTNEELLREKVARLDERWNSLEKRLARIETAVWGILIAAAAVVGKTVLSASGMPAP